MKTHIVQQKNMTYDMTSMKKYFLNYKKLDGTKTEMYKKKIENKQYRKL